jgi:hypothetical protein
MTFRPFLRRPVITALTRFWSDDKGLSLFSALLLIVVFVIPPFLESGSGRSLAGEITFALLLIAGVRALGEGRLARRVILPVTLVTLTVALGSWIVPVPPPLVVGTSLLVLLLFLVVVLMQTLRAGPVNLHRILGAVAAYLLLGLIWAAAYGLVAQLRPGAFTGPVSLVDGTRGFLYFSFLTLTTVGYGDVLPVHPAARSLAMLEAVTGPLYLAILVARLVSLAVVADVESR